MCGAIYQIFLSSPGRQHSEFIGNCMVESLCYSFPTDTIEKTVHILVIGRLGLGQLRMSAKITQPHIVEQRLRHPNRLLRSSFIGCQGHSTVGSLDFSNKKLFSCYKMRCHAHIYCFRQITLSSCHPCSMFHSFARHFMIQIFLIVAIESKVITVSIFRKQNSRISLRCTSIS